MVGRTEHDRVDHLHSAVLPDGSQELLAARHALRDAAHWGLADTARRVNDVNYVPSFIELNGML